MILTGKKNLYKNTLESYFPRVFCYIDMKFSKLYFTNADIKLFKKHPQLVMLHYLKNRPTTGNRAPSFLLSPFSTIMIAT